MKLYLTRSKKGALTLFFDKPLRSELGHFYSNSKDECCDLTVYDDDGEFDFITYENSPIEVELKLKTRL